MSAKDKIYVAFISVVVIGVQSFVLKNDLVWDDLLLIANNPGIGEWDQVPASAVTLFWHNSSYSDEQLSTFWRPVTSVALAVTAALFGKWPPAFHALSLLCLLGAAAALFHLVLKCAQGERRGTVAFSVAAIFAIHPLSTEVLCMAANISDNLALIFWLSGVGAYFEYFKQPGDKKRLVAAAALGFLSAGSKEFGVICLLSPLVAAVLLRSVALNVSLRPMKQAGVWASALLPVCLIVGIRWSVVHASGSSDNFSDLIARFSGVAGLLGLGQSFFLAWFPIPHGAHLYISATDPAAWAAVAGYAALIGVLLLSGRRKKHLFSLSLSGLFLAMLPVLPSLVMVHEYPNGLRFPTRYFYLSLVGFVMATVPLLTAKWNAGVRAAVPVIVSLLALLSWVRIEEWKNEVTLTSVEADYHPDSAAEVLEFASVLIKYGAYDEAAETLDGFQRDAIRPSSISLSRMLTYRADIAAKRDLDFTVATEFLERALMVRPNNLGILFKLVRVRALDNHVDQSLIILDKALAAPWFDARQKETIQQVKDEMTQRSFSKP